MARRKEKIVGIVGLLGLGLATLLYCGNPKITGAPPVAPGEVRKTEERNSRSNPADYEELIHPFQINENAIYSLSRATVTLETPPTYDHRLTPYRIFDLRPEIGLIGFDGDGHYTD